MKKLIIYLLMTLHTIDGFAQKTYSLKIQTLQAGTNNIGEKTSYLPAEPALPAGRNTFKNKLERHQELQNYLSQFYDRGYLAATFDSLVEDSTMLVAYINPGRVYKWVTLKQGNVDEGILSKVGFREKLYSNKPIYYKQVRKLHEKLLTYCENNGYPFASVKLDSIEFSEFSIEAKLNLTKNIEFHIESIIIKGDAKIVPVYLYNYLSIKPGDLYNESLVSKISSRLRELPFVKETNPFKVVFTEDNSIPSTWEPPDKVAKIILHLAEKKASRFNGILGILPNNTTTGKLLLTGEARLKLQNSFGRGELINLDWRKLQVNTQDLKVRFIYPFIISSPFGVDFKLTLYKKDTLYLDLGKNFGIQYLLSGANYLKVFIHNKKSTLLSTKGLENATTLPPHADVSTTIYGLGYKTERLDYRLNPRKGFLLNINGGTGNKNIIKNPNINPELYDSLELKSTEINFDIEVGIFMPIKNRSVINFGVTAAYLSSKSIFENELYRIGGISILRGFDEESILASAYSIFTVEYRYLLEQNSYLYLFLDGAYYENEYRRSNGLGDWLDKPFGIGAGISFETRAGIFSINYAIGQQKGNPLDLRSAKIHFGIVNRF